MERSADVLAAGLLEVSDPSLSNKFFIRQVCILRSIPISISWRLKLWTFYNLKHTSFLSSLLIIERISANSVCFLIPFFLKLLSDSFFLQHWIDEVDSLQDSAIKQKPIWESYNPRYGKDKKSSGKKKKGNLYRTYGTRVIPV